MSWGAGTGGGIGEEEELDDPKEGASGQQQPCTQETLRLQLQQDKDGCLQQVPNKSVNFPFVVLLVGFQSLKAH